MNIKQHSYSTYNGWKRAVKNAANNMSFRAGIILDGDKDICQAGYKNPISGLYHSIGQWDGQSGYIHENYDVYPSNGKNKE